jgi:hypothetical protein
MSEMSTGKAAILRKPFAASTIGHLPKSTCRACSQAQTKRCENHTWVSSCPMCQGNHSSATIHLEYVGHALTTDRLLQADPTWNWEPMSLDDNGLPRLDGSRNLWIKLTVCGVTRIGCGDGSSIKECIGDAIRNAAMRFGVGLDLWSKDELEQSHGAGAERLIAAIASEPTGLRAAMTPKRAKPEAASVGLTTTQPEGNES